MKTIWKHPLALPRDAKEHVHEIDLHASAEILSVQLHTELGLPPTIQLWEMHEATDGTKRPFGYLVLPTGKPFPPLPPWAKHLATIQYPSTHYGPPVVAHVFGGVVRDFGDHWERAHG